MLDSDSSLGLGEAGDIEKSFGRGGEDKREKIREGSESRSVQF